eukprot:scaffold4387_cov126-Isochrysis_galbana.AAC.6
MLWRCTRVASERCGYAANIRAPAREARKSAAPHASAGVPTRPRRVPSPSACSPTAVNVARIMREWKGPGASALTVMFSLPSRAARCRVSMSSPALLDE